MSQSFDLQATYGYNLQRHDNYPNTMAYYNDNYDINVPMNSNSQTGNSAQTYDVRNSNLVPTAAEFHPSTSYSNGAIKKVSQNGSRRNNQYGSGRTYNSSRGGYYSRNPPRNSNEERNKAVQDAKNFFQNNVQVTDNNVDDNASSSRNQNRSSTKNQSYNNSYGRNNRYTNRYEKSSRNYYSDRYYNGENYSSGRSSEHYNQKRENKNSRLDRSKGNWRSDGVKERSYKEQKNIKLNKKLDAASQKERLEEMLNHKMLECLVCCEKIKNADKIWTCSQCYHILHLQCISAWASSSKVESNWRCPACQNVYSEVPKQYKCYCGKTTDPRQEPGVIPHGCGETCLRKGRLCEHKCTILCHPGPCPDCNVMVAKPCGCGKTSPIVKCCTDVEIVCESICDKLLECGIHNCKSKCHSGKCNACEEVILQECYCGKQGRKVPCTSEFQGSTKYECDDVCDKLLTCGNHKCKRKCHEGDCDTCERDVGLQFCPCGKTRLEPRTSCLDPIPCCDKICGKKYLCGQPNSPHRCQSNCHDGQCPPCNLTTLVRCRCGHMDKELPCTKVTTKADDARCEKKCTKKRLCGKHRCNQRCCIEIEHICPLPCNHQLSCGLHRCERTCHSGRCPSCLETSFEELYCECGSSVLYPPVACGTKPPQCNKPCSRARPCGHDINHSCHTGPCPPCTVLCKRWCYGHHEQRATIPCHQLEFSCGLPCGKPMPCGRHKCIKPCHNGPCALPCKQPCTVPRTLCGHPCNKPCHEPPCPETSCKQLVQVTCICGVQKAKKPCIEVADEFRNYEMEKMKEKMEDASKDQTVDLSEVLKIKKPAVLKILECTDECRVLERNRRLAIGLQIRNPDISQKLTPRYSDFMRQWAKKDAHFCQRVHDKLTDLVQLAKQSKQKSRAHSFESMNRDKRHFIHEYCEHFGVESAAYDQEPNRNIIATANRDKSWLPSMSLLEVIQRENGQRKVPGPVLSKSSLSKSESVSLKLPTRVQRPSTPPGEIVDYFDNPPV